MMENAMHLEKLKSNKTELDELNRLINENIDLKALNIIYFEILTNLTAELNAAKSTVKTWTTTSSKVHEIIESQLPAGHRAGLGYNQHFKEEQFVETKFIYNQTDFFKREEVIKPIPKHVQEKAFQKFHDNKINFVKAKEIKEEDVASVSIPPATM